MEPNQSANPTNATGDASAPGQSQSSAQPNTGAKKTTQPDSSGNSSQKQQPADGSNRMEYASLQKVMDQLPQGVRDFCTSSWDQIGKLSTTQKVAGVAALAGLGYLALRSGKASGPKVHDKPYRGSGKGYQSNPQTSYRSGSSQSYSSASGYEDSPRMYGGSSYSGGLDRQNESRSGGSYQAGSQRNPVDSASSEHHSGPASKSSMANRNSGNAYDEAGSGFGGDI